jgi:hypothetical protein
MTSLLVIWTTSALDACSSSAVSVPLFLHIGVRFLTHILLFNPVVDAPLEIIGAIIFLIYILGWSAVIGLVVMICLFPVPAWLAKTMQMTQNEKMHATDARVKSITEREYRLLSFPLASC